MIMKEGRLLLAAAIVPSPGVGPTSPTVNLCISISLQLFFWLCRMCTHSHARTHTHTETKKAEGLLNRRGKQKALKTKEPFKYILVRRPRALWGLKALSCP